MATCHGGVGQPSDRDPNLPEQDTDIPSNHLEDIDNFENVEHENHTALKFLTRNLDKLQQELKMPMVILWKLSITWNVSLTDYHSTYNPQCPLSPG